MEERAANKAKCDNCLIPIWCKGDPCTNCSKRWRVIICGAWAAGRADHTQVHELPQLPEGVHPGFYVSGRRRYPPPPDNEVRSRETRPRALGFIPLPHPRRERSPDVTQVRGVRRYVDPHANHVHSDKSPSAFLSPTHAGQPTAGESSSAPAHAAQPSSGNSHFGKPAALQGSSLQAASREAASNQSDLKQKAPELPRFGQEASEHANETQSPLSQVSPKQYRSEQPAAMAGSHKRPVSSKRADDMLSAVIPTGVPRRS